MANPWEKYKSMASDFISSSADKVGEFTSSVTSDVSESVNNFASDVSSNVSESVNSFTSDVGDAANEKFKEIPVNARQFFYDLVGGTEDLTEKDLNEGELAAAKQAVLTSWKRGGGNSITYEDLTREGENSNADVGGKSSTLLGLAKKMNDPLYAMKTLIGKADYFVNDNDEVVIRNKYDFNNAKDFKWSEFKDDAVEQGLDTYLQLRNVAKYFSSSPEDKSSMVVLNLGKIDGITKKSWLARGSNKTTQVLSGDTLSAIAKKNNISLDELVKFNNIKDQDKIKVGQTLKIPNKPSKEPRPKQKNQESIITEKAKKRTEPTKPTKPKSKTSKDYIIKSGDTLSQIAKKNNTTVDKLASLNDIKDAQKIYVGTKIKLS